MRTSVMALSIFSLGLIACDGPKNQEIKTNAPVELRIEPKVIAQDVKVDKFKEMCAWEDVQIVDVRTPEEWASGIIGGALKMNFFEASFEDSLKTLDSENPILVYCKSGGRSGKTMQKLVDLGFSEIYNLQGGITAWNAKEFPVIK